MTERHKKQTAVTADLAKKAQEHNRMLEGEPAISRAKQLVRAAMAICDSEGFVFDTLLYEVRAADALISMDRKYRTLGDAHNKSQKVRILCVDGPKKKHPVIGYTLTDGEIGIWRENGQVYARGLHFNDLVPDEDQS